MTSASRRTLYAHWVPTSGTSLAEAADCGKLAFTTEGDALWFGQQTTSHDGSDAARSGQLAPAHAWSGTSAMSATVDGPGTVSFWWKADGLRDYDPWRPTVLEFWVDGSSTASLKTGPQDWKQESFSIGEGTHVLTWKYQAGGDLWRSYYYGLDCGFVDQIEWKPAQTVTFDANGGSCGTATAVYPLGEPYGSLPTAARGEDIFLGWFTDAGVLVTAESPVEGGARLTLHARWVKAVDGVGITVTSVRQRFPWNGLVDIDYEVFCEDPDTEVWVVPEATDGEHGRALVMATLSGDGVGGRIKAGRHRMTWDAKADNPGAHSSALTVKMKGANAAQTISFAAIGAQLATNRVTLTATATSGLAVAFEVVSGPGVVTANVLTFTGSGTVEVRAVQAGDERWLPATATQTVAVAKAAQTISFAAIGAQLATDRVTLTATATSGGEVTFEVVSGPGVIEGNVLTFTGAGTVEVRAVQAGNDRWLPATATQTVTVAKVAQTIDFAAIGVQTPADRVELSATATSGNAVVFEVVSGPGVIEGNVLAFTGEGTVEVRAVQAGDERWLPAIATQTVMVVADVSELTYMVVDLSAGSGEGASYPVSYLVAVPEGGWTDEYKTTKLVLRRIEPGTFMMGSTNSNDYHPLHQVTLTKPYYMGVFEVTQKQYELVTGSNPSEYKGDQRPVEKVSWNTIRGDSGTYNWPNSTEVDANSFMGRLRARTGLKFDLPLEAQWEYACRAGTTSYYNNGGCLEDDLKQVGRYYSNRSDGKGGYSEHTTVGSYLPNAWGLHDMHGNVQEWCLDWYGEYPDGAATDPKGTLSGAKRVCRGGSWYYYGGEADYWSANRRSVNPSVGSFSLGFRPVRVLSE